MEFSLENLQKLSTIITALAACYAAYGVKVAQEQLKHLQSQATAEFELELSREYRNLIRKIPKSALLEGKELDEEVRELHFKRFYHYFDLCNAQVWIRKKGRISAETWNCWREGMKTDIARPAFRAAWVEVNTKCLPDHFEALRWLEFNNFDADPKNPTAWANQPLKKSVPQLASNQPAMSLASPVTPTK